MSSNQTKNSTKRQRITTSIVLISIMTILFTLPFMYVIVCIRGEGLLNSNVNAAGIKAEISVLAHHAKFFQPGMQVHFFVRPAKGRFQKPVSGNVTYVECLPNRTNDDPVYKVHCVIARSQIPKILRITSVPVEARLTVRPIKLWEILNNGFENILQ